MGAAFLSDVREGGRKARLAVGMYAPQFLGRGLGSEAIRLVLRHAFGTLGMHRVDLKVLDFNDRAIAAYLACGFVEEGRERESCWVDGRWHDDVVMGVLDREFIAKCVKGGRLSRRRGCRAVSSGRAHRGRAAARGGPPRPWRRR